jgi:hypothetical protein
MNSATDIKEEMPSEFEKDLIALINRHSMENGSNTPDFILASYLRSCLDNFNRVSRWRERWYGKAISISGVKDLDEIPEPISSPAPRPVATDACADPSPVSGTQDESASPAPSRGDVS